MVDGNDCALPCVRGCPFLTQHIYTLLPSAVNRPDRLRMESCHPMAAGEMSIRFTGKSHVLSMLGEYLPKEMRTFLCEPLVHAGVTMLQERPAA